MRVFYLGIVLGTLLACSSPTAAPQPLDGVWLLQSVPSAGISPKTMTLRQSGTAVHGTASAMGVDSPIPMVVSGSYTAAAGASPPLVTLDFTMESGGNFSAHFDGALVASDRLAGSVIYTGISDVPQTDSLVFTRQ